jgi:hypothetical protein
MRRSACNAMQCNAREGGGHGRLMEVKTKGEEGGNTRPVQHWPVVESPAGCRWRTVPLHALVTWPGLPLAKRQASCRARAPASGKADLP